MSSSTFGNAHSDTGLSFNHHGHQPAFGGHNFGHAPPPHGHAPLPHGHVTPHHAPDHNVNRHLNINQINPKFI